jgi:hypothetical protein
MKLMANRKRIDLKFTMGDQVLLKLQPYTQSTVANRPFPKLTYKYFGPYRVLECIGSVAYRLVLLDNTLIHPVFHILELKPFIAYYTPMYGTLRSPPIWRRPPLLCMKERHLVKKGNKVVPQVPVSWTGLLASATTWEDYNVLWQWFPSALAWG